VADWDEKAVFLAALQLAPEDREAFIEGACPTPESRGRLRALLDAHANIDRLSASPAEGSVEDETMSSVAAPEPLDISLHRVPDELGPGGRPAQDRARQGQGQGQGQAQAPDEHGDRYDEFRIVRELGRGGMGIVYLAEDLVLGRPVALKVLADSMSASSKALERFRQEARSTATLRHPGIVPIYRFGRANDRYYIVSDFVDGPTLAQFLDQERERRSSMTNTIDRRTWYRRCAEIVGQLAGALEHSHRAKIIHRDVKPSNVLLDPVLGPRLTDFGIAAEVTDEPLRDRLDALGTCHYMSPEQAIAVEHALDQRSDVFSLGVVLYEMLTLKRPFDGTDAVRVLRAVVHETPPRPSVHAPRLSKDLDTICMKALEKRPENRYQSMAHLEADLNCYLNGLPILARPPGAGRRMTRWVIRHRMPLAAGTIVMLALIVGLGLRQRVIDRREALAWLDIEAPAGTRIYIEPFVGYGIGSSPEVLGVAPLSVLRLEPGQYRVTLVAPDGNAIAECNMLMQTPGRTNTLRIAAEEPPLGDASGTIWAPLRQNDSVVEGMGFVPAGTYRVNTLGAPAEERNLPSFFLDRYEVSNAEYKEFVDVTNRKPPHYWTYADDFGSIASLPVVGVSFHDAEAYARWRGKRLPTLEEWQAATTRIPADSIEQSKPEAPASPPVMSNSARTLFESYLAGVRPVRDAPRTGEALEFVHLDANVPEVTGSVDLAQQDVVVVGRSWQDRRDVNTPWLVRTSPLHIGVSGSGIRCAKSDPAALQKKGLIDE